MADNKNMTQEEIDNGEEMTVTPTLDDGREIECVVLTIFPAGGKDYIALLPMDDIEAEDGEVYLYRYSEDENDSRTWKTSRTTMSMRSWQMRLTSFWTSRNMMSWSARMSWISN